MHTIRPPAVAGMFYPAKEEELNQLVENLMSQATVSTDITVNVRAAIVPHAGYIYSGPVAATVYRYLMQVADNYKRIVLLGPSHQVAFNGLAIPEWQYFNTPLGRLALDIDAMNTIEQFPLVHRSNIAHKNEHSLEVQLPFIQKVFNDIVLLPIVVGAASPNDIARVLSSIWDDKTLLLISSDLSHYHDYDSARTMDQNTTRAIETLNDNVLTGQDACGCAPINGLLHLARLCKLHAITLDLRNSGDTAGDKARVVGYGGYIFHD